MLARTDPPRWERPATVGVLLYALGRLVYQACSIDAALPPDEITHVGQIRHQLAFWGPPEDGETSYAHGLVSHRPFLYAWLMARWLALAPAFADELVWLRLGNVALAGATALAMRAWARRAGAGPGERVLALLLLTNLPMWSFLSASVSYDNLAMLLATLAFVALARLTPAAAPPAARDRRGRDALAWVLWLSLGALTKAALLPLAALQLGALGLVERGRALVAALAGLRALRGAASLAIAAATLAAAGGAATLYGSNLLRFGVLEPAANQLLPLELAQRNRIFRQEHVLRSYRAGAIDERQALREIAAIEHPGDRAGARWMLRRARELRDGTGEPLVGRLGYAIAWTGLMAERLFGVMGHRELYKSGPLAWAYAAVGTLGLAALVGACLRGRSDPSTRQIRISLWISASYALILMQLVNYPIYRTTGLLVEAVQGRYLFPVLAPLLASAVIASTRWLPPRARWPLGTAVAVLFVLGDFPYLLLESGPDWWSTPPVP